MLVEKDITGHHKTCHFVASYEQQFTVRSYVLYALIINYSSVSFNALLLEYVRVYENSGSDITSCE